MSGTKPLGYLIENLLGKRYGDDVTEGRAQAAGNDRVVLADHRTSSGRASLHPIDANTTIARTVMGIPSSRTPGSKPAPQTAGLPVLPATSRSTLAHCSITIQRRVPAAHFADLAADYSTRSKRDPSATYGYGLMTWKQGERLMIGHSGEMVGHYRAVDDRSRSRARRGRRGQRPRFG